MMQGDKRFHWDDDEDDIRTQQYCRPRRRRRLRWR